jgi:hypothetical protein
MADCMIQPTRPALPRFIGPGRVAAAGRVVATVYNCERTIGQKIFL